MVKDPFFEALRRIRPSRQQKDEVEAETKLPVTEEKSYQPGHQGCALGEADQVFAKLKKLPKTRHTEVVANYYGEAVTVVSLMSLCPLNSRCVCRARYDKDFLCPAKKIGQPAPIDKNSVTTTSFTNKS